MENGYRFRTLLPEARRGFVSAARLVAIRAIIRLLTVTSLY
jgi:hypothetical protein